MNKNLGKDFVTEYINDDNIREIINFSISNQVTDIKSIVNNYTDLQLQKLISSALFSSDEIINFESAVKMFDDTVNRLKLRKIREKLVTKRKELDEVNSSSSNMNEKRLMEDYRNLILEEKQIKGDLHEI